MDESVDGLAEAFVGATNSRSGTIRQVLSMDYNEVINTSELPAIRLFDALGHRPDILVVVVSKSSTESLILDSAAFLKRVGSLMLLGPVGATEG